MRRYTRERVPRARSPTPRVQFDPQGTPSNRRGRRLFYLRFAYNFSAGPRPRIEIHGKRSALAASIREGHDRMPVSLLLG
jgi:hypothetical protein